MFQGNLIKTTVNSCCYFFLFAILLTANSVGADQVADIDPNGNFSLLGVLTSLWEFVTGLFTQPYGR